MHRQQQQQRPPNTAHEEERDRLIAAQQSAGRRDFSDPMLAFADPYGGCIHNHVGSVKAALRSRVPPTPLD
jgi:hypothetical protein